MPTHIGLRFILYQPKITVRMFQVLNYYREIILCVVTCCVYNYLFLHYGNKKKKQQQQQCKKTWFLSVQWILNWDCYVLAICHHCFRIVLNVKKCKKTRKNESTACIIWILLGKIPISQYQFQFHGEFSIFRRFLRKSCIESYWNVNST